VEVAHVAEDCLDVGVSGRAAGVKDARDVARGAQAIDDVRADEPCAARDEYSHPQPI
jgi:hypothetical protein